MKEKKVKTEKEKTSRTDAAEDKQSRQYETMSQQQNRHGKGREHNGSDGSSNGGRGSNH
jgi:hypothetical protein